MLHKPKISTLKHLHSIPRYFMHSIPIGSIVALLALTVICINPSPYSNIQVYALEDTNVRDTISIEEADNNDLATVEREDSTVAKANSIVQVASVDDGNDGIMPLANETVSLTLGSTNISAPVTAGEVGYASNTVTYGVTGDVYAYSLGLSYANGYDALKFEGNEGTTITGVGTSGTTGTSMKNSTSYNNKWGYAWSDNVNTAVESLRYKTVPAYSSPTTFKSGSSAVSTTTGKLAFAAKFANNAILGHYKTALLVSLVATPKTVTRTITYNANGGTSTPAAQSCTATTTSTTTAPSCNITITTDSPTISTNHNIFLGWSTNNAATSADVTYAAGKTISLSSDLTLYAVWQWDNVTTSGFSSITTMQEMTSDICTNEPMGATKALKDTRNSKSYSITKLNDNRCWMTKNLEITGKSIYPRDSNVPSSYYIPSSSSPWASEAPNNVQSKVNVDNSGVFYSWCAATAGQGRYCEDATTTNNNSEYSICPKGWKLPTKAEYDTLLSSAEIGNDVDGSNKIRAKPYYFDLDGLIVSSSVSSSSGRYWTSTADSEFNAYGLEIERSTVHTNNTWRYYGFSVRCIAQ